MMPIRPQADLQLSPDSTPARYDYFMLGDSPDSGSTQLADECALALSYNGISHAVMMVSPSALEDFAVGFSIGNGLISSIDEIYDIRISGAGTSRHAALDVSSRAFWKLKQQRRELAGHSGCGLCGVEALEQALPELSSLVQGPLPTAQRLIGLRERIGSVQTLARHSGALHAAVFVDTQGDILCCREDIGRHNALDKLIGALQRQAVPCHSGFAAVTSRCSLELIHKAIRAGIGTLVSLSAPTALSVQWARQHHLNLIHLPHHSEPRVYSPGPR